MKVTVVIPARNEEKSIYGVVSGARQYADDVIVVDDGSVDATGRIASEAGATVTVNKQRRGYITALRTGIGQATGDIIVTMDADGEHNPGDIPLLIQPLNDNIADLVLGRRTKVTRLSERFINWLTRLRVKISDSCTGFRAMRRDLALKLSLKGQCTCGTLVLEAAYYGARVIDVPNNSCSTDKPKKVAWYHIRQIFHVLGWLLK